MTGDPGELTARDISAALGVGETFDAAAEAESRLRFLVELLGSTGAAGFVLGVSGGIDSSTAGRLCQLAVERRRAEGGDATFVAMRLPYGTQADEADAQRALAFIRPDVALSVDIRPAADALRASVQAVEAPLAGLRQVAGADFVHGNVKARQRMVAQYAVANAYGLLVVGTDHAAEAVTGFFTKHGDGACDLVPLAGLTKRRVRAIAAHLGAERALVEKTPTADLESARPGIPDEDVLGLTYDEIDDFLEGNGVSPGAAQRLVDRYSATMHKRTGPAAPVPQAPAP